MNEKQKRKTEMATLWLGRPQQDGKAEGCGRCGNGNWELRGT
uniref:Uncharacterized protein n=1 Tax=Rhizophora mucronata TaxID=61149 RepID=A0A2P2M795_RHIMU